MDKQITITLDEQTYEYIKIEQKYLEYKTIGETITHILRQALVDNASPALWAKFIQELEDKKRESN